MQGIKEQVEKLSLVLQTRRLSVVTAESCTGGGIARILTDEPGASSWFERGFVTYSNLSKQQMLDVPEALIEEYGAVSEEVVLAMARGALRHSNGDVSVAVSGVAGPDGGSPEKPVGTVWIAWGLGAEHTEAQRFHFPGGRDVVRSQAIRAALEGLNARLG